MNLDLTSLYKLGGFSGPPVKREVTFQARGEDVTGTVWVRRMSYQSAVGDMKAMGSDGEIMAARISSCIVDENGERIYQKADVTGFYDDGKPVLDEAGNPRGGMSDSLVYALWRVIAEVNDLGKQQSES